MKKYKIKILTFLMLYGASLLFATSYASILTVQKSKSYLRWNIFLPKDQIAINKIGQSVFLRTLSEKTFKMLSKEVKKLSSDGIYIKSIKVGEAGNSLNLPDMAGSVNAIEIKLRNKKIELFSFYRNREKKHVVDFWTDTDEVGSLTSAIKKRPLPTKKRKIISRSNPTVAKKTILPLAKVPAKKAGKSVYKILPKRDGNRFSKTVRDFRYGASFIWGYKALAPELKRIINLKRKTPEYFYPIKKRDYLKSNKEAHLQLSINLYNKKKWGLMHKSITLFHTKYGENTNVDINEYLKANALIRNNFKKGNDGPVKMAINMLENISERTNNYDLQKGILKYLITYLIQSSEHIQALQKAKKLYVITKNKFDVEESAYAAELMLFNLYKLGQIEVIRKLLSEKRIMKLLPKQIMSAYELSVLLKLDRPRDAIRLYEKMRPAMIGKIHSSVIFNIAEAYFREGRYKKAIKQFDKFIREYSYMTYASHARLRIALAYEILGRPYKETLELYKNALNRSQDKNISYEAKIRYVALRSVRKVEANKEDKETRVFLERGKNTPKIINKNLLKLLWLVRLRSYITDHNYIDALAYLNAIPLNSMLPAEKRVFESDGAEIIYGLLISRYKQSRYSRVVQTWEVYRNRYVDKVATDPFMNFIVGHSFIKLGLFEGFDRLYKSFEKIKDTPTRTFPIWTKRTRVANTEDLLLELDIIRNINLKNWEKAESQIAVLEKKNPALNKVHYYMGIIQSNKKDYNKTIKHFEIFLSRQRSRSIYDVHEVADMIRMYTDAIYEQGNTERYKKVASAVLSDLKDYGSDSPYMHQVKERVSYLEIEIIAGDEKNSSFLEIEEKILNFKKKFAKSLFAGRVNYLYGTALMDVMKDKKAKIIFEELVKNETVPGHVKELARSELSLLKIKEKTL